MSGQETQVFRLETAAGGLLGEALTRAGYLFRSVPHARFQAQGEGVTVTLYDSGKLVLQGRQLAAWAERYLPDGAPAGTKAGKADLPLPDRGRPAHGSDEAGKGDTFGPLVVCAVHWPGGARASAKGLVDSKLVADERVRVLAPRLRESFATAERVLDPAGYNHRWSACGNVNRLLAELHGEVLEELSVRTPCGLAVVDAFSRTRPVAARMAGSGLEVVEVPRAERHPAVAAASLLARDRFLAGLRQLEEKWALDLPRGSGAPVPPALRRFLAIHGPGCLGEVAKMHFKNVQAAVREWEQR